MPGLQKLSVLLFIAFVVRHSDAQPPRRCARVRGQVRADITSAMVTDNLLIPKFVRAAFHDCITATSDIADSGCNGSLRLDSEINDPNSAQIEDAITLLDTVLAGQTCVSYADAIQIGMKAAMGIASGGTFPNFRIRENIPDATDADDVTQIPGRADTFVQLKTLYEGKGFTSEELVASLVGGHALGRFFNVAGTTSLDFTTTPFAFNIDYATNLVQRIDSGSNLAGFNTLAADSNLLDDAEAVGYLKYFAGQVGTTDDYNAMTGRIRLTKVFSRFLQKLSFLTSADVTV